MLEIIILFRLAKRIGAIVTEKGRKKGGYQLLLVVLWFGGEIFGGIVGGVLAAFVAESEGSGQLLAYGFALAGAIVGAVIAFQIAKHLEPLNGDEAAFNLHGMEVDRWSDRFKPNNSAPRVPDDGYTGVEPAQRPPDDRIQH